MPRPQPIVLDRGRFNPDSPRYRYQPLPLRTAINQLEKLVVHFGEDVITQVRSVIELAELAGADQYRAAIVEWNAAKSRGETVGPAPKAGLDIDMWGALVALASGLQGALTGTRLVSEQTEHFLVSEVEVEAEIDGALCWVRLVKTSVQPGASTLDCEGYDYDLPPADAFPLWRLLLEVNLLPLFRAGAEWIKKLLTEKSSKGDASSTPSSAPAVIDSPAV